MKHKHQHDEVTLERLERARAAIAYAMTLDGAVYGPIFERLESEIAALRAAADVMVRARRCFDDYAAAATPTIDVKAICRRYFSFSSSP
jgi:hypothetical protein